MALPDKKLLSVEFTCETVSIENPLKSLEDVKIASRSAKCLTCYNLYPF